MTVLRATRVRSAAEEARLKKYVPARVKLRQDLEFRATSENATMSSVYVGQGREVNVVRVTGSELIVEHAGWQRQCRYQRPISWTGMGVASLDLNNRSLPRLAMNQVKLETHRVRLARVRNHEPPERLQIDENHILRLLRRQKREQAVGLRARNIIASSAGRITGTGD